MGSEGRSRSFFLFPTAEALGPAAGPFMEHLTKRRRMAAFFPIVAALTILAGAGLYWRDSNGLDPAWITSGPGLAFTIGGLAAIAAFVGGLVISAPRLRPRESEAELAATGVPTDNHRARLERAAPEDAAPGSQSTCRCFSSRPSPWRRPYLRPAVRADGDLGLHPWRRRVGWCWHLVEAAIRERGHETVAPDLPIEDDAAGLSDYAAAVVDAIGDRRDVAVVAQSFGGYVAPIVAELIGARLIVLVAGMIPMPGESAEAMFGATGWEPERLEDSSTLAVSPRRAADLAEEASPGAAGKSDTPGAEPWHSPPGRNPTRSCSDETTGFFRRSASTAGAGAAWHRSPDGIESGTLPGG